ncbi:serine hydrolase domain-containing protein [Brevundimonas sp. GCM10030266]|uniref:serine hydrolase domain-containing protein n=1 Tax=Brevundimonas sp. GCM10030266 TaxID=3273386 RepID=UPI00360CF2C6
MRKFAGFPVAGPEALGFDRDRLDKLNRYMEDMVGTGRVAGVSTLILRHGKVVEQQTHGSAQLGGQTPLSTDAIFRIYSMTKPIAATAMMILFEDGHWVLDDPVTKFVPEFADLKVFAGVGPDGSMLVEDAKRPPTMREVMSHTAGFAYGLFPDFHPLEKAYLENRIARPEGDKAFIDSLAAQPLMFQPGTEWFYSVASGLLGVIVSRISGQSFGDFIQERIFAPLGMVDTAFQTRADNQHRLVTFYQDDQQGGLKEVEEVLGAPINPFTAPPEFEDGGGGLVSTISDYARFAQMILNKGELDGARILAPVTVELMATNVIPDAVLATTNPLRLLPFNPAFGFGLGFSVMKDPRRLGSTEGRGTLAWGGMGGTWFWIDPENDLVFVGLIQRFADPISGEFRAKARTFTYTALTRPEL